MFGFEDDDVPEEKEYIVTMTVQLAVSGECPAMARISAIEHVQEMISRTEFKNDNQNCYTVDNVELITMEDDL